MRGKKLDLTTAALGRASRVGAVRRFPAAVWPRIPTAPAHAKSYWTWSLIMCAGLVERLQREDRIMRRQILE